MTLKSRQLVERHGISYHRIVAALRSGKVKPPPKDCSGDYLWAEENVEELMQALATDRRRKAVAP